MKILWEKVLQLGILYPTTLSSERVFLFHRRLWNDAIYQKWRSKPRKRKTWVQETGKRLGGRAKIPRVLADGIVNIFELILRRNFHVCRRIWEWISNYVLTGI